MQRTDVKSSQIHSVGYDPIEQVLEIQFQSRSGVGSVYRYEGVPPSKFHEFMGSESLGKYFGAKIKDDHPTFKQQGDEWVPIAKAKASAKSLAMLRDLAIAHALYSGTAVEVIGPQWRRTLDAAGTPYANFEGDPVDTWLGTLLQSQCSGAIDSLKSST
jgi:hypothetical protein